MNTLLSLRLRRSRLVLRDAGVAEPVAVDQAFTGPGAGVGCWRLPVPGGVESGDDRCHGLRLRADAQHLDAHLEQFRHLWQQIVGLCGHRLDAVDGQKWLSFARAQGHPLGMVETLELAVVLVEAVVARREAARREGQRQLAENEDLGFDAGRAAAVQRLDQRRSPSSGGTQRCMP
jgi:hypothetical protein